MLYILKREREYIEIEKEGEILSFSYKIRLKINLNPKFNCTIQFKLHLYL